MERLHSAVFSVLLLIMACLFFGLYWYGDDSLRPSLITIVFAVISLTGGVLTMISYALSARKNYFRMRNFCNDEKIVLGLPTPSIAHSNNN
ncbi:TPA: hypothetical protein ACKPXU_004046 [Serratia marcescens]